MTDTANERARRDGETVVAYLEASMVPDPETAARTLALFVERVRDAGAAVVLVTHSRVAAAAADRELVLTPTGLVRRG